MMEEESECPECVQAIAPWMATFADLMSLLMCFFVLLLSFSEMDVQSYKRMAGSMKAAFGVQREVKVEDLPKASSIIAQEFSPGKPTPTVLKIVQQQSTPERDTDMSADGSAEVSLEEFSEMLAEKFEEEIQDGSLEVILQDNEVKVRLNEKATFPSGSAQLQKSFTPVITKLSEMLNGVEGRIVVAGHTDNIPIRTAAFPSNWELSAARAASVVHLLSKTGLERSDRLEIRAYAETVPVLENVTPENRAVNRRVEIIISPEDANDPYADERKISRGINESGQPD